MHKQTSTSESMLQHGAGGARRRAGAAPLEGAPGRPLDGATRSLMEARFEHDFSQVRVHSGAQAAASARSVNALAYTVGRHVVFGERQLAPDTSAGRRLMAHELAHVVQQDGRDGMQARLAVSRPGDLHERQADTAAQRVMQGQQVGNVLTPAGPAIQRQDPPAAPEPEKKEAGDVILEGLKVAAEQAPEKLKEKVVEPFKLRLKGKWEGLSTGEKVGVGAFGVGTLSLGAGALASDPKGRKMFEDLNLAAPLALIPNMPLSSFKVVGPSGTSPEQRSYKFELAFDMSELLNLRTKARGLQDMKLTASLSLVYDPLTDRTVMPAFNASLGLVPGLSISGGLYKDILRPPGMLGGGPGAPDLRSVTSIPALPGPRAMPDVRVMLMLDLREFKPAEAWRTLKKFF